MPDNNVDQWALAGTQTLQRDQAEQIRNNMQSAVVQNPDQAAQNQHLAKYVGVPVEAVAAQPDVVKQQAAQKSMDTDKLVSDYPALSKYLVDPNNAAKSHDDIAPLAAVEQAAKALPAPGPAAQPPSFGDTMLGLPMDLAKGLGGAYNKAASGVNIVAGAFPVLYDKAASLITGKQTTSASDAWFHGMVDPLIDKEGAFALAPDAPFVAKAVHTSGNLLGMLSQIVLTGSGGEASSAAGTTAEVVGNQMAHGAKSMAFPALTDSVDTGRKVYAETGDGQAAVRAAQLQYLTSTSSGVVPLAAPGSLAARAVGGFVSGATLGEASRSTMNMVLPSSMQQPFDLEGTLLSGLAGSMLGGVMGTRGQPAYHDAIRQTYEDASKAEAAEKGMSALQALGELASGSKTRERDPEGFKAFVKSATEDGPLQDVYVDANKFAEVLNQSGVDIKTLAATMPEVAAQFHAAVETSGDIRIPVEDYATHIAGGKLDAALLPHLKVDPDGFTHQQGQEYFQNQQADMSAQAEKLAAAKQTDDAAQLDAQVVHDHVLGQLDAAARFRPEVNKAYAAMTREFYATQAERAGITPSQLYERYPLKITGETSTGGFNQEAVAKASSDIRTLAVAAAEAGNKSSKVKITPAQDWLVQAARDAGLEIAGFEHSIDASAIRHVRKNHGDEAKETARGQLPVVDEDFERIPQIIAAPDTVIFGTQNRLGHDQIGYLKKMPDGSTLYLEEVRNGRKELAAQSMRKYPATMNAETIVSTLNPNARSDGSESSITQFAPGLADPTDLAQGNRGGFDPETNTISLMKGADLSTYLHESGHFFLETMHDMARAPDAPEGIRADFDTLLSSFGEKGATPEARMADWSGKSLDEKRAGHEQFAEGFEKYLMEGKAPTLELQGMFSRFRSWLVNVYKSLSNLKVELTPEVRQVMDRLLASDDAIRYAEQARSYLPLTEAPEGTSAEQFATYQALGREATDQAVSDMTARSMRDMKWASNAKSKAMKALQKEAKGARDAIREEVTKEVDATPIEQARTWLSKGVMHDAQGNEVKADKGFRLDSAAVREMFPDTALGRPDTAKLRGLTGKDGLHPDIVAEMFGMNSGEALVRDLIDTAGARKEQIEGMTDQRMLEQHGELIDGPSIERAAEAAIHNEARARFMATGLKMLSKSPVPARQLALAAKEAADAAIAAKRVRDLRPAQHMAEEGRANREAVRLAPKDPAGAVMAQRAALLNNRLFRAASDAVAEVQKGVEYLKKFDKDTVRGKIALDIRDQIDDLLARFDLRQKVPDGLNRKQINLQQWIESQVAAGYTPAVTLDMLNPGVRMPFKDMTVEQFRGLVDSVKAMEYIGRKRQELTIGGERVDLDDYVATKLVPKLQERGERFTKDDLVDRPEDRSDNVFAQALDKFNAWRRAAAAQLKPTEFKRNEYDRHELLGPMGEAIFEPVLNANYAKVDMLKGLSDDFQKLADAQGKDWQNSLRDMVDNKTLVDLDKGTPDDPQPLRVTRAKMIGMAIHVGNESNFNKLTAGWGWKPEAVWSFLHEHMTEKDWIATQGVWDLYEKHWPEMEAMNRRLGNTSPDKIEPRAFPTKFGEQRGGYAAIAYDPLRSRRGEKEAQIRAVDPSDGLFGRGYFKADTTTNGSLNGRVDGYTDRVELDFHHIATRMHETIHDLAYRETAIDVNKVLEHPEFRAAFRSAYGPEAYRSLQEWLGKVINSENGDQQVGALGRFLQYTRTGMVMTAIALRASTVLKHGGSAGIKTTGYFVGGGEKYLASRFASMGTDYKAQISGAKDKFGEIRARLLQQDRDFRVTSTALFEPEYIQSKAERFGHAAVAWSDMMTAVPTAWAAYDRAITEGIPVNQGGTGAPMTEAQAVNYANKIVREAHGSNIETARSMALNTSSEALKMFTTLYGFMNTSYGQALDGFDKLGTAGLAKPAVLARSFMALIVPAIWAHTLTHGAPGDDEGWAAWIGKAVAGEVAGMVPFVRDVVPMVEGYSHAGVVGAESWMSTIVKAAMDVRHMAEGKDVKAPIKDIANAAGMGLHIPGLGQIGTSAQYAADVAQGKEHPADKLEYAEGIALGHGAKKH